MQAHVYNGTMFVAWLLVSVGVGAIYWPAGLIVAGLGLAGVLLLTLHLARLGLRFQPRKPKNQGAAPGVATPEASA